MRLVWTWSTSLLCAICPVCELMLSVLLLLWWWLDLSVTKMKWSWVPIIKDWGTFTILLKYYCNLASLLSLSLKFHNLESLVWLWKWKIWYIAKTNRTINICIYKFSILTIVSFLLLVNLVCFFCFSQVATIRYFFYENSS